jgi:pilus assembly protein Flp/PilA
MPQKISEFWRDDTAATAIEYCLISAAIGVGIVASVNGIGSKLNTTFGSVSTQLR